MHSQNVIAREQNRNVIAREQSDRSNLPVIHEGLLRPFGARNDKILPLLILSLFCLISWFLFCFPIFENRNRPELPARAEVLAPLTIPEKILIGYKVSINDFAQKDWEALPKIGPKTAQAIIDYKQAHGPFQRVEELLEVRGIGPKTL
ncbi:MAG: helix-hairpin-helix domain-containing protein, partial [Deltaproteobacteria bacterium]|nr:helix-hairpin-helix domain-containing protein [Deltaproteobacteria bacterium]